jgi:hypothetical protein
MEGATCSACGSDLEWVDCEHCGGEGEYECYEEDPLWYDEDDMKACAQCGGTGGWYWCGICRRID